MSDALDKYSLPKPASCPPTANMIPYIHEQPSNTHLLETKQSEILELLCTQKQTNNQTSLTSMQNNIPNNNFTLKTVPDSSSCYSSNDKQRPQGRRFSNVDPVSTGIALQ